ncbi:anthranilate phosphoribosyltransferase [Amycolatopsis antarctica]|uniref:anthranilate phosphoribosyltransferase n=1 Tax=Amycolatopsis antarctica TaxID=1854586 RepID=UPI00267C09AC
MSREQESVENADARWNATLATLVGRVDLTADDTEWVMHRVMRGEAEDVRLAAFLAALRTKGETVAEIEGLIRAVRAHAVPLHIPGRAVDIVGTGGDRAGTVNISTVSAIIAAAAGARIVKHGNRSSSSACGSADLLEELGVFVDLPPRTAPAILEEIGLVFCFAPLFHSAMRHASAVRRKLGVPTAFNLLGPLTNPALPAAAAVGVADERVAPLIAGVLADRGASALVFRGDDGLDELTVTTTSRIWNVREGAVDTETFDPREVGIALAGPDALRGGAAPENAAIAREVLAGRRGPVRDAVLLSAAAGMAALEPTSASATERIGAKLTLAARAVDSGAAEALLERWTRLTSKLAAEHGVSTVRR